MTDRIRPCGCADFSRTELFRRAAASAGEGLPPIESGMPLPAGTGLSRRSFIARTAGLALSVYGASNLRLPLLDEGIAHAATQANESRVLVSVFLDGGADVLNLLFPAGDSRYYELRPKLALSPDIGVPFDEDSRLRWHPSAQAFATLHGEGKATVFPSIGYTSPDKSHFTSRHYWEVGATDATARTGWLGRFLDQAGRADNPLQGLALDNRLQPALATAKVPVASMDGPDRYSFKAFGVSGQTEARMLEALGQLGLAHERASDKGVRQAGDALAQSYRLRGQVSPFGTGTITSPVKYPGDQDDDFPRRLASLAAMLAAGLPLRCVALSAPGRYDTHADQADELSDGIKLTADSLLAFQRDLEARGLADRVLVHVWSEFGRRARENGSLGTDHGAAGFGLLLGTRAGGKMVGEYPGLTSGLDSEGNLKATSDFRGVYSGILEQWFETDAGAIIPNAGSFARPKLVR
ncbi:MAG: DUF1501 domain-containing protein [Actinobacteria bacterium]|nr:DUF1501 domain-containing protein [Actinomycetota bacterium]